MTEPPRLRDGGEDLLAATLLDAARAYRRPPSTRNRIAKMLGLPIVVSAGAPATAAVASSLAAKVIVVVSAVTVVAGGGAVAYQVHARHEARQARLARASVAAPASPAWPKPAPITARVREADPSIEAPLEEPPAVSPPAPLAAEIRTPVTAAHVAVVRRRAPPAVPTMPSPQEREIFAPVALAPPATVPIPLPPARPAPPAPAPTLPAATPAAPTPARPAAAPRASAPRRAPLAREIALLDAADRAERRHDHVAALASLNEYTRAFPDGALLAEAQVLRIAALLGMGDDSAAQEEARLFFARYAPSPLTARVRSMLSERSGHDKELP